jgi:hypothetical protein
MSLLSCLDVIVEKSVFAVKQRIKKLMPGNVLQQIYRQILIHHAKPHLERLFDNGNFILQQDNDP